MRRSDKEQRYAAHTDYRSNNFLQSNLLLKEKPSGCQNDIGVSAINVEAMPAPVYCTAINEKETPRNGPNMVPPVAAVIALQSPKERTKALPCRIDSITIKKPLTPTMARINVEANGIICTTTVLAGSALSI